MWCRLCVSSKSYLVCAISVCFILKRNNSRQSSLSCTIGTQGHSSNPLGEQRWPTPDPMQTFHFVNLYNAWKLHVFPPLVHCTSFLIFQKVSFQFNFLALKVTKIHSGGFSPMYILCLEYSWGTKIWGRIKQGKNGYFSHFYTALPLKSSG